MLTLLDKIKMCPRKEINKNRWIPLAVEHSVDDRQTSFKISHFQIMRINFAAPGFRYTFSLLLKCYKVKPRVKCLSIATVSGLFWCVHNYWTTVTFFKSLRFGTLVCVVSFHSRLIFIKLPSADYTFYGAVHGSFSFFQTNTSWTVIIVNP